MADKGVVIGVGVLLALGSVFLLGKGAEAQSFRCPVCNMEFGFLEELQEHFASAHPRESIPIDWK